MNSVLANVYEIIGGSCVKFRTPGMQLCTEAPILGPALVLKSLKTCLRLLARYLHVSLRAASRSVHSCLLLDNSRSIDESFCLREICSLH